MLTQLVVCEKGRTANPAMAYTMRSDARMIDVMSAIAAHSGLARNKIRLLEWKDVDAESPALADSTHLDV